MDYTVHKTEYLNEQNLDDLWIKIKQYVSAHGADVKHHCLIGRCGVQAVGPVALVKHAVLEIRPVVEEEKRDSPTVFSDGKFTHRKIGADRIIFRPDRERIEIRILR